MNPKRLLIILGVVVLLLSIPFIAMQFTTEVDWKLLDFVIMGVLLFSTGLVLDFVLRKAKSTSQRILLLAAVLIVFFLIWAELAVGILGTPFAGS